MQNDIVPAPLVTAVVLNWNGIDCTVPCLRSLQRQTHSKLQIVVVDNGSADNSLEVLNREFGGDIVVLPLPENLGFTGGCNAGIEYALANEADYILLVNNDTESDPEMVQHLVAMAQANPRAGIVTSKIFYHEPRNLLWSAGGDVKRGWLLRFVMRGYGEPDSGRWDEDASSPFISGCCMLIPRRILQEVGSFDDRFFAYVEDSDLCMRVAAAGWELLYTPKAVMWHKESASIVRNAPDRKGGKDSPFLCYLGTRNRIWVVRKHGTAREKIASLAGYVIRAFLRTPLFLARRNFDILSATWRGIRDGLFTRL